MVRVSVFLAVAGAAYALLVSPALAAFPGENGRIAFQSNRDGNWEIYTMKSDGSDETRLTRNDAYDGQPAISPDGQKIAFISQRDGSPDRSENPAARFGSLWIMNSDGSGQQRLTDRESKNPAFSPDGKRITFSSVSHADCFIPKPWENIFVTPTQGGANEKLTKVCDNAFNPSFSPDGSEILFQGTSYKETPFGEDAVLWVDSHRNQPDSSPGTAGTLVPTEQMRGFSFRSDGSQWAYSLRKRGGLLAGWRMNSSIYASKAGGPCGKCSTSKWELVGLSRSERTFQKDDVRPSFAPAGDWVAFERRPEDPSTNIFEASNVPIAQGPQVKQLAGAGKNMAPDWGPRTP